MNPLALAPLVTPPYDPARAHDLAMVVAGLVSVLLVAAFAMPARRATKTEDAARVLGELIFGAALLGFALVTEMLALFGIAHGLGRVDQHLLFLLLFVTGVVAFRRMIAPLIWDFADDRGKPPTRFWWIFGVTVLVVSVVAILLLGVAES